MNSGDEPTPDNTEQLYTGKGIDVASIFEIGDVLHESNSTTIEIKSRRSDDWADSGVYLIAKDADGEVKTYLDFGAPLARHLAQALEDAADHTEGEL